MPQPKVRFNCVQPSILQLIRTQLLHQADTATFLEFVDEHSCTLCRDDAKSQMKLVMAVAPHRVKDFPCRALRMNADDRRGAVNVPQSQSKRRLHLARLPVCVDTFKGQQAKVGPTG